MWGDQGFTFSSTRSSSSTARKCSQIGPRSDEKRRELKGNGSRYLAHEQPVCRYARANGKGLQEHARDISELPSAGSTSEELTFASRIWQRKFAVHENGSREDSTKDTPLKKKKNVPGAHPIAGTAAPAAAVLGGSPSGRRKRLRLRCRLRAGSGSSNQTPAHRTGSRGGVQGLR